eukprot:TRINITY_DN1402_c0_g1_i1.p2 TRINITY_DN1402_c0_g1~~TRINITY_DN1402_c0_g1_i1.p2  ORF type:complete len:74 (+),score=6.00 TRINITY_DN1402_c0_g1_i1:386-607(+)
MEKRTRLTFGGDTHSSRKFTENWKGFMEGVWGSTEYFIARTPHHPHTPTNPDNFVVGSWSVCLWSAKMNLFFW